MKQYTYIMSRRPRASALFAALVVLAALAGCLLVLPSLKKSLLGMGTFLLLLGGGILGAFQFGHFRLPLATPLLIAGVAYAVALEIRVYGLALREARHHESAAGLN